MTSRVPQVKAVMPSVCRVIGLGSFQPARMADFMTLYIVRETSTDRIQSKMRNNPDALKLDLTCKEGASRTWRQAKCCCLEANLGLE